MSRAMLNQVMRSTLDGIALAMLASVLAPAAASEAIRVERGDGFLSIDTDTLQARINSRGYVSGITGGSLLDKTTGARDLGHGLCVMDFLLAPGWRDDEYGRGGPHGDLAKHYVGRKGFRPGTVPEAEPLAQACDIVLTQSDGMTMQVVCSVDREKNPQKTFAMPLEALLEIGQRCLKYTGKVSGQQMPVTFQIVEVGPGPGSPADRQRLAALKRKSAFGKVIPIAWRLDTTAGKETASFDIVGDTDDLFYDASRKRLYVTGGDGSIDVVQDQGANKFARIARVPTAAGARTSLFVADQGRLYVAVPHRGSQKAEIRVFEAR